MFKEVWVCGRVSGKNTDKFILAGLKTVKSIKAHPPRIKRCPVQLECKIEFMKEFWRPLFGCWKNIGRSM